MKIYVGNLSFEVTDQDLQESFAVYGQVASAMVVKDAYSGRSRGFGFVEMANDTEATAAINGLNGKELKGRTITVNQARPRESSAGAGGGRGGYGGGGGGGRRSGGGSGGGSGRRW